MLQKWLFAGELQDPFSEFFVAVNPDLAHVEYLHPSSGENASLTADGGFGGLSHEGTGADNAVSSGMRLWESKYQFKKEMLPRFVAEAFGKKVRIIHA
jgi:gamma-tubulin complex component 3